MHQFLKGTNSGTEHFGFISDNYRSVYLLILPLFLLKICTSLGFPDRTVFWFRFFRHFALKQ